LVHKLAKADGIQTGLKITNKKNVILFDSSWIAEVDYNNENYEEEQYESIPERDEMNHHETTSKINRGENTVYENAESCNPAESVEPEKFKSESEEEELSEGATSESESEKETTGGRKTYRKNRETPPKLNLNQSHLIIQGHERTACSIEAQEVIAKTIIGFNHRYHYLFAETYGLKKGIKNLENVAIKQS
jgi:hypothetical protein